MTYTAIIPIKKNSSRLPGKNILRFGDENLLTRKIRQLKLSGIADRIIVSSDSDEMLDMAKKQNVDTILRPKCFADESKPLFEFFEYIGNIVKDGHLIWSCVTSPFFDEHLMKQAKIEYKEALNNNYDSLITTYDFNHYLMDDSGPLNYGMGQKHQNSQELNTVQLFTNGILFAPINSVRKWQYNYGPNAYRFKVGQKESIDIDTEWDYKAAISWI